MIEWLTTYGSRKLQIDLSYYLKGGFMLLLPIMVEYGIGLVRSVLLARWAGRELYGQYGFLVSIVGITGLLSLPGIGSALIKSVAEGKSGALHTATLARLRWGIAAAGVTLLTAAYFLYVDNDRTIGLALVVAAFFLPLRSALHCLRSYYQGCKRFDRLGLLNVALSLTNLLVFTLMLATGQPFVVWIFALGLTEIVVFALFFRRAYAEIDLTQLDPEMVAPGRALTWAQLPAVISRYLDKIVLGMTTDFATVGIYTAATILPERFKSLIKLPAALFVPKIAEHADKRIYSPQTRRHLLRLFALNVVLVAVLVVLLPPLIRLLYGAAYAQSIGYAQLLMASMLFGWPGAFFRSALLARQRVQALARSSMVYGVLFIGLLIVLVPGYGVLGIVGSRILSRWAVVFYQWYEVTKL